MFKKICKGQPAWLALCVGIGTALGVAFDNLAMGVGLGAGIGAALQGMTGPKA